MKLGGISQGTLYSSGCASVFAGSNPRNIRRIGRLPDVGVRGQSTSRVLQTYCASKAVLERLFGTYPTTNVWPVDTDELYATRGNRLLRSDDRGETWVDVRRLPRSSGPMGILPTGLCVTDEHLYVGEYPLDDVQPRILQSPDGGETWTTAATPDARHVHAVTIDPFTGDRWVTTGDGDDESMLGRLTGNGIETVGTGSQLWRAVDLAFTPDAVLWGMDCPYATENRLLRLERDQVGANEPSVETLHTVTSPVYFAETVELDGEYHVFFSTTIEPATAPQHTACVLHGSTADDFDTWRTLATYDRASPLLASVFDTNAYVFLAACSDRGLFVNPYNTDTDSGMIRNIPVRHLRTHGG